MISAGLVKSVVEKLPVATSGAGSHREQANGEAARNAMPREVKPGIVPL